MNRIITHARLRVHANSPQQQVMSLWDQIDSEISSQQKVQKRTRQGPVTCQHRDCSQPFRYLIIPSSHLIRFANPYVVGFCCPARKSPSRSGAYLLTVDKRLSHILACPRLRRCLLWLTAETTDQARFKS